MGLIQLLDNIGLLNAFGGQKLYTETPYYRPPSALQNYAAEWIDVSQPHLFEIYQTTAQLYAVIDRRGKLLSTGEWKHYRIKSNGEIEEVKDSEYVKLLENPNPMMSGNEFLRLWNENLCVYGNNFMLDCRPIGFNNNVPYVLNHLPVEEVEIDYTGQIWRCETMEEIVRGYKLKNNNERFETNEVLHTKIANGKNPLIGSSPFVQLQRDISNLREAKSVQNVLLSKPGARGILSPKTQAGQGAIPLTPAGRKEIEQQWERQYGIGKGKNQVMIAQTAIDWVKTTFPAKEMMLFEQITSSFQAFIDHYGMNDNIFCRDKASTFTNMAEGFKQAYTATVIPDADEKAMSLSKKFGLVENGEFLSIDFSKVPFLETSPKDKSEELNNKADVVKKLKESLVYNDKEIKDIVNLK